MNLELLIAARDEITRLKEQFEATRKALDDACDVAIWLSGLPCLRNSDAWTYWESDARPKLYKAMELLDSNPAKEPQSILDEHPEDVSMYVEDSTPASEPEA